MSTYKKLAANRDDYTEGCLSQLLAVLFQPAGTLVAPSVAPSQSTTARYGRRSVGSVERVMYSFFIVFMKATGNNIMKCIFIVDSFVNLQRFISIKSIADIFDF